MSSPTVGPSYYNFHIRRHDKQGKGKGEKNKRSSTYSNSKERHEAGDAELLIVQSLEKSPSVGNATPP